MKAPHRAPELQPGEAELLRTVRIHGRVNQGVLAMQQAGDLIASGARVRALIERGLLTRRRNSSGNGKNTWMVELSIAGAAALKQAEREVISTGRITTAANYHRPANYEPKELRPFEGRAGAMRAYELPSLVGGQRVERRAPMAMASGARDNHKKEA